MFRGAGNPEIRDVKWSRDDGRPAAGNEAIFPICTPDNSGKLGLIGTAFFITTNGIFVTAKHVLMNREGSRPIEPLIAIHFLPNGVYLKRPVINVSINNTDVAIGSLAVATHNATGQAVSNPILTLTSKVPEASGIISTFAYPKSFVKDRDSVREIHLETSWHSGYVTEYLANGRDTVFLPGPCYRTTMDILHGASGGPVMNTDAQVFAVNSTGYEGVQESYVSAIQSIGGLYLDEVVFPGEPSPRSATTNELIDRGFIKVQ
jgi:hypothetical protein